jgi:SAM-dependent methyltransferase
MPEIVTKGAYLPEFPMLSRIMLRKCELKEKSCLDLGSMEGLIPVLMARGGASSVLATDAVGHCVEKMAAVKHYYRNNFDYRNVGPMYDLYKKLAGHNFDLINCSGLLYHTFSPMSVLSDVRPLLKRNGLMIVSTHVILENGFSMEFNNSGRIQNESNTFWYITVPFLDYMLRYFKLAPIDCIFSPNETAKSNIRLVFDKPSGQISVLCRAMDSVLPTKDDKWMTESAQNSWEYMGIRSLRSRSSKWDLARRQPISSIRCKNCIEKQHFRDDVESLDLWEAISNSKPIISADKESDACILRLHDTS